MIVAEDAEKVTSEEVVTPISGETIFAPPFGGVTVSVLFSIINS